jgi:acetyl-CoA acyltransferase
MTNIFIAGISMTRFGPSPDATVKSLSREAVQGALADANATPADIEAAYFANVAQDVIEGQVTIAGQIALHSCGITGIPVANVENACASGSTAVWLAINQLKAGTADIVLALGAEKLVFEDKVLGARAMRAFEGGVDVSELDTTQERLAALGAGIERPGGSGHRSFFMDIYANLAKAHMNAFGTTQQQMAVVASKNHQHSTLNDKCHYNKPMTVEEVLAGRPLAYPLTVPMCSPFSDGAAAAVLVNDEGLKRLGNARAIKIMACELTSATERTWDDLEQHVCRRAADKAYEAAAISPDDIDVAEVHDAAAFGEIMQTELLGFCEFGGGGALAESGATRLGGRIPVNVSGGLECKGHPLGATGIGQLYELATQLRGEAGSRQVEKARFAIQENGGGLLGIEEASAVVTILGVPDQ